MLVLRVLNRSFVQNDFILFFICPAHLFDRITVPIHAITMVSTCSKYFCLSGYRLLSIHFRTTNMIWSDLKCPATNDLFNSIFLRPSTLFWARHSLQPWSEDGFCMLEIFRVVRRQAIFSSWRCYRWFSASSYGVFIVKWWYPKNGLVRVVRPSYR